MTTQGQADKSLFLTAKDQNTGLTKLTVSPSNFQVGMTEAPADLTLMGRLSVSSQTYSVLRGGSIEIDSNVYFALISVENTFSTAETFVYLPSAPRDGQTVFIKDKNGVAGDIVFYVASAAGKIDNLDKVAINSYYGCMGFCWSGGRWNIISDYTSARSFPHDVSNYQMVTSSLILWHSIGNQLTYVPGSTKVFDLQGNSNMRFEGSAYVSTYDGYLEFGAPPPAMAATADRALITETDLSSKFLGTSPTKSEVTSIFMWVFPMSEGNILVERGTSSSKNVSWRASLIDVDSSGYFRMCLYPGSGPYASYITISVNSLYKWCYVGMTYDGATLRGYYNGVYTSQVTINRSAPYNNGYGLYYSLGASNNGLGMYINDDPNFRFAELQVYNTCLTDAQVQQNYTFKKKTYIPNPV